MSVKEFYAKMTMIHLKKKDIVKSKVRGVEIEFDHEKLATILGIPRNNGICEYVKDEVEKIEEGMMMRRLRRKRRKVKMKEIGLILTGRRSLMRQAVEGESGSGRSSMMLEEDAQGSPNRSMRFQRDATPGSVQQKDKGIAESTLGSNRQRSRIYEIPSEFERKRANQFHDDLEKAKARECQTFSLTSPSPNQTPSLDLPYLTFPPEQLLY
ncbi:hypothetical protein Dimus_001696 [Dionaea muscipula]